VTSQIIVAGAFDDLGSRQIRFLEEVARLGPIIVALWSDELAAAVHGKCKFPLDERRYVLEAIRFVERVLTTPDLQPDELPMPSSSLSSDGNPENLTKQTWAMLEGEDNEARRKFCADSRIGLAVIPPAALAGFTTGAFNPAQLDPSRKRVIVTGCYDWFHSGHVRFFEECSQLGDLYVVVGHDANVRLLKGEGHPFFPEHERRYLVGSCRYVKQALVSSGAGWMDAEPEIALVRPHIYAVNEDGDKPEKRAFCATHGLEYVVLTRTPRDGLAARSSTQLRGY